jgi:acyl-CoA:acyl-CoA alkyltransferase
MFYTHVFIESFGYELPPNVVTSEDLEFRLEPVYQALRIQKGTLEAVTGIHERRFWNPGFKMSDGAVSAGKKAIAAAEIDLKDIGMLVYGGVCRDLLEPATACAVAHGLGLGEDVLVFDVSNACLGILNGMLDVANAIELGQIRAGLVVSCESARHIVDSVIRRLLSEKNMEAFRKTIATLTGGSGAVAVLLSDGSFSGKAHRILGAIAKNAARHHELCIWEIPHDRPQMMETDSAAVLANGVKLGVDTFMAFKQQMKLENHQPDKLICHQVGAAHQRAILDAVNIPIEKDFTTYRYLGNIGTVSLPITAAIADERGFLESGDRVGFLGIGSGLNCLMFDMVW